MSAESSRSKTTTLWCMDFANYFRFTVSKWTCHSQLSSRESWLDNCRGGECGRAGLLVSRREVRTKKAMKGYSLFCSDVKLQFSIPAFPVLILPLKHVVF